MTQQQTSVFAEKNFEILASALDRISAPKREIFLTKLVILLASKAGGNDQLENFIERAEKHL